MRPVSGNECEGRSSGNGWVREKDLRDALDRRLESGSAADAVHGALVEGIESGWLPPGTRLTELYLARVFSVSRTPIREALMRIEAEHIAERDRHRGLVVGRITVEQIIEIYVVREALDGAASRLAASSALPFDIEELTQVNGRMKQAATAGRVREMAEMNVQFHLILARASRNEMLVRFTEQLYRIVRRFQTTTFSHPGRGDEAVAEHEQLIAALQRHDQEAAEGIAREHMRRALEVRIRLEISARDIKVSGKSTTGSGP